MADDDSGGSHLVLRAEAYGPESEGASAADLNQNIGSQNNPLSKGDIAVSPGLSTQYPYGTYWDAIDPATGQVLRSNLKVADSSWISEGQPTTNTVELYNDQDLGHVVLRPSSGHEQNKPTEDLHGAADAERWAALSESPEPKETAPPPADTETPIDKAKKNLAAQYPDTDFSKWKPADYLPAIQKAFPDVPADKLAVFAAQPGGAELIKKWEVRDLNPLERFRKLFPQDATGDDDKDIEYLHKRLEPNTPIDQFREKIKPPPLIVTVLKNIGQGLMQGTVEQVNSMQAGLPPGLEQAKPMKLSAGGQGLMAGMQDSYAWIDQLPKSVVDQIQALYGVTGTKKFMDNVSGWLSKNVPAYGGANDYFKKYLGHVQARSDEFSKQAQAAKSQIGSDLMSQVAGTVGEVAGGMPVAAVTFGGGLMGLYLEGTSAYGAAVEHQQKNALLQGISAMGFLKLMQYTLNTGKGRAVSGIATAILNASQGEMQKFLSGQPCDIFKEGKAFLTGLAIGVLGGGKAPEVKFAPESVPVQESPSPTVTPKVGTPFVNEWSFNNHPPEVREELQKAHEAHEAGDNDVAAQHLDKAYVFMPDSAKRAHAADVINKIDELAGEKPSVPRGSLYDYKLYSGAPPPRRRSYEERMAARRGEPEKLPYAIQKLAEINPGAAQNWKAMPPEDQQRYINSLEHDPAYVEPGKTPETREQLQARLQNPDTFNDYYFAGIPSPVKAIRDWFDEKIEDIRRIPSYIRPDRGEAREVAAQIIRQTNVKSQAARTVVPAEISRKHGAVEMFRKIERLMNGDRSEVQQRYINTRSSAQQLQDLIDYQNHTPIKDKLTNYIFQNIHRPLMESIIDHEHRYGIDTPEMRDYIMHNWVKVDEWPKLQAALKQRTVNPSFTKSQQMEIEIGTALGMKLKSTNITEIDRLRMMLSEFATRQIAILRQLEDHGYAWESSRKDVPQQYRDPKLAIDTADKKSYFIQPDLIDLWNNAFDKNSVYDVGNPLFRAYFKTAGFLKGAVAWKVSFSGFHPLHITEITGADIANNALWRMRHGEVNWRNARDAVVGAFGSYPGGIYLSARHAARYRSPVSFLQGHTPFKNLTQDEQRAVIDFQDMGLDVAVNQERALQFMNFFQKSLPQWEKADKTGMVRMAARALDLGANWFNRWWFHDVTPNLKFASAMMRRDTLAFTRPELFKARNRPELLREYGKIHRDIEGRYGEMNYENLFQPRWLKQLGTTHLLSYGWQLGLLRVMGDGVIDTTTNLAHWKGLVAEAKARGATGVADKVFNERLSYLAIYGVKMLVTGTAISVLVGGKRPDQLTLWDGVYPYVGKDPTGRDKRINMQYFFKEIPSYSHYAQMSNDDLSGGLSPVAISPGAVSHMMGGKTSPMMSAAIQAFYNKDYMDHSIGTMPDRIKYLLAQGMEPITFENMAVAGASPTDWIMTSLGFAPSGRWTMRTDMENKVMAQYAQYMGAKAGPIMEARDEYRQAFIMKDSGAIEAARQKLLDLHATEIQIRNIEKSANVSAAMKKFNQLPHNEQLQDLREMTPEERAQWLPHASPAVRVQVQ